jgi:hypothetical protein
MSAAALGAGSTGVWDSAIVRGNKLRDCFLFGRDGGVTDGWTVVSVLIEEAQG